jgi:1,4-alpha-glucan branching enzyme
MGDGDGLENPTQAASVRLRCGDRRWEDSMTASTRPGMGALLFAGGASFRVWAPFATKVCVAGSFNGWSMTANPLTHEGNGYWSTDVSGAKLDDQYKFVLTSPFSNKPLWKNDPYARAMTNSVGNSIIAETDYAWATAGFSTPPWNEARYLRTACRDPRPLRLPRSK